MMAVTRTPFAAWLLGQLADQDMRAAHLSEKTGITRAELSKYLNKGRMPLPKNVAKICEALGVSVSEGYRAAGIDIKTYSEFTERLADTIENLPDTQRIEVEKFIDALLKKGRNEHKKETLPTE